MIRNISILLSIILLGVLVIPASAQTSNHVVINEVDINPPGDDSVSISEWIELYNPTSSKQDIGGWKIASTTGLKKIMTVPAGTFVEPGKFVKFSYQSLWFTDANESVELRDENGMVIDKTPLLSDLKNDFSSWQRLYDGYDNDSVTDWKYALSNAGSSNGKQPITEEKEGVSVTLSVDKSSYLFGETAIISGHVSEELVIIQPYFQPEKIILTVTGPNYKKIIELYPDMNLNYKTSLNLQKVLGINTGLYTLSVTYGTASTSTSFSVGDKIITDNISEIGTISIATDKSDYIPGQTLTLTGMTSEIIPYEGLKFTIKDPTGKIISNGSLFPKNGQFVTTVFLNTVNPVYGTYEIIGEYFDKSTKTTFEVIKDIKEDKPISLWTDKVAYGLGDTVKITGRLNQVWVDSLDLQVLQSTNLAIGYSGSETGFRILDIARIQGDGTFSYSFKIPQNDLRLGDYRITVSKEIGTISTTIHVVSNPDEFVSDEDLLSLNTSKPVYDLGETLVVTGFIKNPSSRSSFETDVVTLSILNKDGTPLQLIGQSNVFDQSGVSSSYQFTSVPSTSGGFSFKTNIAKNIFHEGTYLIKAKYLGLQKDITFDVIDPVSIDKAGIVLNKDVFGLGETVTLNGILPTTGAYSVSISLTKPDGSILNSGASINNQKFSWTWTTPISEKPSAVKTVDRSLTQTNYGIYKINISIPSYNKDVFFKVSPNPETDSLSQTPLYVYAEKPLYHAGEKLKVIGSVIARTQGSEGLVVPDRVLIKILDGKFPFNQIHESQVYPNQGGEFQSVFELPITVFSDGQYIISASYSNKKAESVFGVVNEYLFGSSEPVTLLLSTDKSQYHPGDTVILTGKPSKLIYLEKFEVSAIKKSAQEITCGSFYCGKHIGEITSIRPSPSGSFAYEFQIPNSESSIGNYEMTVDADFETKSIRFDVVAKPIEEKQSPTIIEKQNRITESQISITSQQKTIDGSQIAPRVISGSLLTNKNDQQSVNLRVTSESGVCVIGPESECLVKESTRKPGQIYDIVDVDGVSLKIRYSGPDVRLEKFDILPESSDSFLPDSSWNVDVIKDDQVSRFYYKVNYKELE